MPVCWLSITLLSFWIPFYTVVRKTAQPAGRTAYVSHISNNTLIEQVRPVESSAKMAPNPAITYFDCGPFLQHVLSSVLNSATAFGQGVYVTAALALRTALLLYVVRSRNSRWGRGPALPAPHTSAARGNCTAVTTILYAGCWRHAAVGSQRSAAPMWP